MDQKIKEAKEAIETGIAKFAKIAEIERPEIGVILGSGLGPVADQVTEKLEIPYDKIPHFHKPSVAGHAGKLILGKMKGVPVVFLQGRCHFYEGHPMAQVVFPTRVLGALG